MALRRAKILCHVLDHEGTEWDVRRVESTSAGFNVYQGWPAGYPRGLYGVGGPAWILTPELVAWLEAVRFRAYANLDGMPFGKWALKRMRRQLGHHGKLDRRSWWLERLDDLANLTSKDFVSRHHRSDEEISDSAVDLARMELLGWRGKRLGEWRKHNDLILSGLPSQVIADRLGLAVDVVCRLRYRLEEERGLPHHQELGRRDRR